VSKNTGDDMLYVATTEKCNIDDGFGYGFERKRISASIPIENVPAPSEVIRFGEKRAVITEGCWYRDSNDVEKVSLNFKTLGNKKYSFNFSDTDFWEEHAEMPFF
jgi:hypothetical protein